MITSCDVSKGVVKPVVKRRILPKVAITFTLPKPLKYAMIPAAVTQLKHPSSRIGLHEASVPHWASADCCEGGEQGDQTATRQDT